MNTSEGNINFERFNRQRRNLIGISIIIAFYSAGSVEFDSLNILGNQFAVGNPDIITGSLWLLFIYLLWRYYTAFQDINGVSYILNPLRERVKGNIYLLAQKKATEATDKSKRDISMKMIAMDDNGEPVDIYKEGAMYSVSPLTDEGIVLDECATVQVTKPRIFCMKIVSFINICMHTSALSEYILPFIVAGIALTELLGFGLVSFLFTASV